MKIREVSTLDVIRTKILADTLISGRKLLSAYIIEKNSPGVKNLRTPVGKNSGAYERTVCLGSVLNLIARW